MVERYVNSGSCVLVYSWGKAELGAFWEDVDFLGVEAICKVSDQVDFVLGGVFWLICVLWFGSVLWFVNVLMFSIVFGKTLSVEHRRRKSLLVCGYAFPVA